MFEHFGEDDPRKMPTHLFYGARHIDYSTAIKANISRQDFSVCPRCWYIDAAFHCAQCRKSFVFTASEQQFWYEELKFYVDSRAKHCQECRKKLRDLKKLKQEYDRDIAAVLANDAIQKKERMIAVIDALNQGGVKLSGKMNNNRRTLSKQIERLRRSGDV